MSGRTIRFRGVLAATALAACTGVVLQTPAAADTRHFIYEYTCTGGHLLRDDGPKKITVDVTIPTSVRVGERLAVDWTLSDSPLASSADFKAGGRLIATGTAGVKGLWSGRLDATGTKEQAVLAENGPLELPSAITGSVTTTEAGKLTITPGDLLLDFIPPADTVRVNDNADVDGEPAAADPHKHGPITYNQPSWFRAADRSAYKDHSDDLHATATQGDSVTVTFVGTGLAYIGERVETVGEFEVSLGDDPKVIAKVNAHDPAPQATPKAQEVLWSKTDFPYDEHTVTFKNVATAGTFMAVDAFDIITRELSAAPDYFRTKCTPQNAKSATVEVLPAPTPTGDDDDDGDGQITDGDDSGRGVNVLSGGGQAQSTATATATVTRTPTPRSTPQVRVTPKGGAQTGEAPGDGTAAPLLIGYGAAMTVAGITGGVLRRRRRRGAA